MSEISIYYQVFQKTIFPNMYNNIFTICTLKLISLHKKGTTVGNYFLLILILLGMSFHAVVVFYLLGLGYDVLFKSIHSTDLARKSISKI